MELFVEQSHNTEDVNRGQNKVHCSLCQLYEIPQGDQCMPAWSHDPSKEWIYCIAAWRSDSKRRAELLVFFLNDHSDYKWRSVFWFQHQSLHCFCFIQRISAAENWEVFLNQPSKTHTECRRRRTSKHLWLKMKKLKSILTPVFGWLSLNIHNWSSLKTGCCCFFKGYLRWKSTQHTSLIIISGFRLSTTCIYLSHFFMC